MRRANGFTLLELLVAMALGALVLAGLLKTAQATSRATAVQRALVGLQAAARFAEEEITVQAEGAGFRPDPWTTPPLSVIDDSVDGAAGASDRLVLRRWSRRNCLGNDNPVPGPDGLPSFYLRESEFTLRENWRLVETCRYGPGDVSGTRQLNAATLVEGVENFQVQFAEDTDGDRVTDRWVKAGHWTDERHVIGVRFALLLAPQDPVGARARGTVRLLDETMTPAEDGRIRLVVQGTVPMRGRLP